MLVRSSCCLRNAAATLSVLMTALLCQVITAQAARAQASTEAPDKERCVASYVSAQKLRLKGALRAAKDELITCSQTSCPQTLRQQCAPWLEEVEAALPTVVFAARDESGQDTLDVEVELDGKPWLHMLPTRAVAIDPGQHALRLRTASGRQLERQLVVREGEKNRLIEIDFSAGTAQQPLSSAPVVEAEAEPPMLTVPVLVAGGVALAALGSFTGFGLSGKLKENELADTCAPSCAQAEVDDVRTRFLVADISLGAAVLSAGVSALLLFLLPTQDAATEPSAG